MRTVARQKAMAGLGARWRREGLSVGLVPTMGALHQGHAALIRRARRENDRVVVSVFVNPLQFGPREDFARYPRSFPADRRLCRLAGADAVYHPSVAEMYPDGFASQVEVPPLAARWEGALRPGHFRGVATVVLKLLNTCAPTRAYFGEKDYQQLTLIRRMAADLDLPVSIVGCPTVRERDGLALSSRNVYLSPVERAAAPVIRRALQLARDTGDTAAARRLIAKELPGCRVDYLAFVDAATLEPAAKAGRPRRLLAAVRVGKTRLIDNLPASL
jgi:pantoate--beta-alanine ligase